MHLWFDLGYIPHKVKDVTLIESLAVQNYTQCQEVLPQTGCELIIPILTHLMRQLVYKECHFSKLSGGVYL